MVFTIHSSAQPVHRCMTFDGGGGAPNRTCDGYFLEFSVISFMFSETTRRLSIVFSISRCWLAIRRFSRWSVWRSCALVSRQIVRHRIEPFNQPIQTLRVACGRSASI